MGGWEAGGLDSAVGTRLGERRKVESSHSMETGTCERVINI